MAALGMQSLWCALQVTLLLGAGAAIYGATVRRWPELAAWAVAQFGLALHVYHPLAHWLVARLQLQQELAADRVAARLSGSRRDYLKVLATMWLRQDEIGFRTLARTFLPAENLLSRRITMLRTGMEREPRRHVARFRSLVVACGLLVLSLAATLRSQTSVAEEPPAPAERRAAEPVEQVERRSEEDATPKRTAREIDRTWTQLGVISFRPAKFFGRPEARPMLAVANQLLLDTMRDLNLLNASAVHLDCVAEVTAKVLYGFDANQQDKAHDQAIAWSPQSLRVTDNVDVARWFQQAFPSTQVTRGTHATVFEVLTQELPPLHPDLTKARTVSFLEYRPGSLELNGMTREAAAAYAAGERTWRPSSADFADWPRVDRGLITLACGKEIAELAKHVDVDEPLEVALGAVLGDVDQLLGCVELDEQLQVELILSTASHESAERLRQRIQDLLTLLRTTVEQELARPAAATLASDRPGFVEYTRSLQLLLSGAQVVVSEHEVRVSSQVRIPVAKLAQLLSPDLK
jgi:hypothetical protein